jgi:hypothetical protein
LNAGDGKTAFLQHLARQLGTPDVHSSQRVWRWKLPNGRALKANLDGSAAWQGKSANTVLDEFFAPFHAKINDSRVHVIAINSGKLLEWLESQERDSLFTDQLYRVLMGEEDVLDPRFRLIDLNSRSLVGGLNSGRTEIATDFLDALIDKLTGKKEDQNPWAVCPTCTAQYRCTAWRSVRTLRDPVLGPTVRARLTDALQASHMRGEIHITAREIRAALVFILFGVDDCADLHADPELTPAPYFDRAFDALASHRQGELLAELVRFDPALEAHPTLDRRLLKETLHASGDGARALARARRCAYFEWTPIQFATLGQSSDAIGLANGRYLDLFRRAPTMDESERTALCRQLCEGMSRLEDLPPVAFRASDGVPLRITPRTPIESAFWVVKPWDRFALSAPLPRMIDGLEVLHTHLIVTYRYPDGGEERLAIGLELFHLLLAMREGEQLSGAGHEGIFAHLEVFTQRLARENARELYGWNPAEENRVFRVAVKASEGQQVLSCEAAV